MIYFCIPCHNEERTVGIVLWKIRQVMAELPRDYQLLVADDASTDRSYEVLEPYSRVVPLILMRNLERRGYAATLEMLLREAVSRSDYPRRDSVVVMQADFTDDPEYAVALLKRLESGADIAVSNPRVSVRRRFTTRIALGLARRYARRRGWPAEVTDPLHGFHAYRLACLRTAFSEQMGRLLSVDGAAANAALLHAALPHARRVDAVDIVSHPERLQRPSRLALLEAVRNAARFARGETAQELLSVEQLRPDSIHGDRAALKGTAAALAATGNGRSAEPRPAATDSRRSGREERAGRDGRRGGRTADSPDGERRPRRAAAASSVEDTKPRSRKARPTGESATPAEQEAAPQDGPTKPRRRRGGRGRGSRRTTGGEQAGPPAGSTEDAAPADRVAAQPVEDTERAGIAPPAEGPDGAVVETGEDQPKRRRRRGRRGGRRHRARNEKTSGTEPADGTVDAPDDAAASDGPAPAVPGSQGDERNGT